jgi:hypothetical protein
VQDFTSGKPHPHTRKFALNMTGSQDQLLQHDYAVYPVNPVAAKSYRQPKAPSGLKTDSLPDPARHRSFFESNITNASW